MSLSRDQVIGHTKRSGGSTGSGSTGVGSGEWILDSASAFVFVSGMVGDCEIEMGE